MTQGGHTEELKSAKQRIMEATHRALQEHGYGNLTIQHIVDGFEDSKTPLYYHYNEKDELLVDFLDYVLMRFLNSFPQGDRAPREELETLVDALLPEMLSEEAYRLQLSIFKLRVNIPHDEDCREEYHHIDAELMELLWDILIRNVEAGESDVNGLGTEAELFLPILTGMRARRLMVFKPDESIEPLRAVIQPHIDRISA